MAGKKVVIVGEVYDPTLGVGGGPIMPGEPPLGIWGPPSGMPTPPIYIPVPPPPESGLKPEHPIYIPVYPAHPIVIPVPPLHPEHPIPPIVWPPIQPKPPEGIWGPTDPRPSHPIYIPIEPPESPGKPTHPIFFPVYPSHPIVLPPDEELPDLPPDMVNPPTGLPGFWGYSVYYDSMVFVPYEGAIGVPQPPEPSGRGRK